MDSPVISQVSSAIAFKTSATDSLRVIISSIVLRRVPCGLDRETFQVSSRTFNIVQSVAIAMSWLAMRSIANACSWYTRCVQHESFSEIGFHNISGSEGDMTGCSAEEKQSYAGRDEMPGSAC